MAIGFRSLIRTCLLACTAFSAHGSALYEFTGTYQEFGTGQIIGPVTFSLSLLAPVSPIATFLETGPELTCSDCSHVTFYPEGTYASGLVTVGYGLPTLSEYYFYFLPASYTQSGAYQTQLLAGVNDGTLTTRITNGNQVPEPGTLALLGLGLAGLTAARRRKQ